MIVDHFLGKPWNFLYRFLQFSLLQGFRVKQELSKKLHFGIVDSKTHLQIKRLASWRVGAPGKEFDQHINAGSFSKKNGWFKRSNKKLVSGREWIFGTPRLPAFLVKAIPLNPTASLENRLSWSWSSEPSLFKDFFECFTTLKNSSLEPSGNYTWHWKITQTYFHFLIYWVTGWCLLPCFA